MIFTAWVNRFGQPQKYEQKESPPIPKDNKVSNNNYEHYAWNGYTQACSMYVEKTIKWEKLEVEFYKATLTNGDVIFYIANDNDARYMTAQEAKFSSQKEWLREFARRFHFLLDRRDMTQQMVADATGISKTAISYYTNCKRIPSAYTLRLIADGLGTTVEFLSHF